MRQNEDGGWGLHIEGSSTMFGSALSYIALRILGEGHEDSGDHRVMARGRKWILDHGGLVAIPSLGKFWVSVWLIEPLADSQIKSGRIISIFSFCCEQDKELIKPKLSSWITEIALKLWELVLEVHS